MKDTTSPHIDYHIIASIVEEKSSVLDLGCGDGSLMSLLIKEKKVKAQGIEINQEMIYACVAKGLNVFLGDLDSGLADYENKQFDFVILNQCLQQLKHPATALKEALRVGKKVIVGFPNFAYYKIRFQIFFQGKTPVTKSLPYPWYETPNLHFLTIRDFLEYCQKEKIKILKKFFICQGRLIHFLPNLFAEDAIFEIEGK